MKPTSAPPRALLLAALLPLVSACSKPCLDMCQQYQRYLEECGYGWSTTFHEEGWASIDDCYDSYWEAGEEEQDWCEEQTESYRDRSCY